ncbi:DUF4112 domain-containing protein [Gemmatimonadota bacterium]
MSESVELDARRLKRLQAVARVLDDAVEVPLLGFRVGLDPLLGLLPGAGDVVGATFSGWMVVVAARMGATPATLARMLVNLGLDLLSGAVPLLGDIFDIAFKANRRNLRIVEEQVLDPEGARRRSRALVVGTFGAVVGVILALLALIAWAVTVAWGWVA